MEGRQNEKKQGLRVVSIRLVDDPPLRSSRMIETPEDAVKVIGEEIRKYDRELFCVLNLTARMQVIHMNIVTMGTLDSAMVCPREVFKPAVLSNAAGIILMHNHPSGNCTPSKDDLLVTRRLEEAGLMLGIEVKDHIIVGSGGEYYSFLEHSEIYRRINGPGEEHRTPLSKAGESR